ncbi:VWA domain-containing protein [Schlesneria paludicola]|uniref:VWA domain-containing protein n=1 Tax=Schlesneria paludicola TaxID=360056 RepID=UPI00029A091B|nr:VWA domain-containing protein [Schlesneria paludicola]
MPPESGPSWRGSAPKPAPGNARSWRRPGNAPVTTWNLKSGWLKGFFSLMSVLAAFVAICLFIYLIFVPGCNQVDYSVLAPAPYTDPAMPPQPFAQQDAEAFRGTFRAESLSTAFESKVAATNAKPARRKSASSRSTRVLYITALAGQDGNGDVVLYREGSGPDSIDLGASSPNGCVPLDQVREALAALPAEQKKVLVIDVASGPIDWRWGQFARPPMGSSADQEASNPAIDKLISDVKNLAVITSGAPGEPSWASPILKQSVFAHFLCRALAGDADGCVANRRKDGKVTLDELHQFLLTRTNHWVQQNRDPRGQHPQMRLSVGSSDNFLNTVLSTKKLAPQTAPSAANDEPAREKLKELWIKRDKWEAEDAAQWHPVAWRQLLEHLRRAERWWLAGQPEEMDQHLIAAKRADDSLTERDRTRDRSLMSGFTLSRRAESKMFSYGDLDVPEDHLKRILESELAPTDLPKSDVDEAVKLRKLAEQQSWHSYRSRLWTGSILDEADASRRAAEDLLFVGGKLSIDSAADQRKKSLAKFDEHKKLVIDVSDLVRLQNRLLAELPELAFWASQRIPEEMISKPGQDAHRFQVQNSERFRVIQKYAQLISSNRSSPPDSLKQESELAEFLKDGDDLQAVEVRLLLAFEQLRRLSSLIDREKEKSPQAFAATDAWRTERDAVVISLNETRKLKDQLTLHAKTLIGAPNLGAGDSKGGQGQTQYYRWLQIRNALQWSGLLAEARGGLLAALEESDRTRYLDSQKTPIEQSTEWNGENWTGVDGCWQALWALQVLSLDPSYVGMNQRWVDWAEACLVSKNQSAELAKLGREVRSEFRERAKNRALPPVKDSDQLKSDQVPDALNGLLAAERSARTMHGYDAVSFKLDNDPVAKVQAFDQGAMCLRQAERYLEDFWGNSNGVERWFVLAATQAMRAAAHQEETLGIRAMRMERERVSRGLEEKKLATLKIAPFSPGVDLSLVEKAVHSFTVTIDDHVSAGTAALWMDENAISAEQILEFLPLGRRAVTRTGMSHEFTIHRNRPIPTANCEAISVMPRLLYRGQFWNRQDGWLSVNPCPPQSIDREYQSPSDKGAILVQGADRRDTIFIIDCSLSMRDEIVKGQPLRRFDVARKALSDTLKVLRDASTERNEKEPHVIGLMAYGHRAKAKNRDPNLTETNQNWRQPIPDEVKDNWRNDFEILVPPSPLIGNQFRRMNAYVDPDQPFDGVQTLEPYGETPLLGSVRAASEYLIAQKRGGVVVAICDGAYNDERTNGARYRALEDLYRGHPELALHLVAFDLDKLAEIETLTKLAEKTGGKFHQAPTAAKLAQIIDRVMKPRPFSVVRAAEPPLNIESPLGRAVDDLAADTYQVQFPGVPSFTAKISGGERLEFDLQISNRLLKHHRPVPKLSRRIKGTREPAENEPSRFGYLKADYNDTTKRALFEFSLDRGNDPIGMVDRPAEIQITISPMRSTRQFSGSWKLSPQQSVPVWQVELRDWPKDAKPEVQAFWKMNRTEPDEKVSAAMLLKDPQSVTLDDWPNRSLNITAERKGGKLLVKLQGTDKSNPIRVADVRVEVGELSRIESQFSPKSYDWTSTFYESGQQIIYAFDVSERFDPDRFHVALTSPTRLKRDAVEIQSPLEIEKWDSEQ